MPKLRNISKVYSNPFSHDCETDIAPLSYHVNARNMYIYYMFLDNDLVLKVYCDRPIIDKRVMREDAPKHPTRCRYR